MLEKLLVWAVNKRYYFLIKLLLWFRVDIDKEGNTFLLLSASHGRIEVVNTLLKSGVDINAKNNKGQTALHLAVANGDVGIVEALLEKGADINAVNEYGWTVLHLAAYSGDVGTVKLLLEKGADINAVNEYGWTVLHSAAAKGNVGTIEALLEKGADINAVNEYGWTALHLAAYKGYVGTVKALLEKGADVNAVDKNGWTALHFAANSGDVGTVEALLKNGANINIIDKNGGTVLHLAAYSGDAGTVEALLENGADINVINKNGMTALDIAKSRKNEEIISLCTAEKLPLKDNLSKAAEDNNVVQLRDTLANDVDDTKDIGIVFLPNQACIDHADIMTAKTKKLLPNYTQVTNNPHITAIHIANLNEAAQNNLIQIADRFFPQYENTCIKFPVTRVKATGGNIEEGFKWLDLQFNILEPLNDLRAKIIGEFCPLHNGTLTRMNDDPSNFIEGSQAKQDIDKCGVTFSAYIPHITAWYINLPDELKTTKLNDSAEDLNSEITPATCYAENIALVELGRNGNAIDIIETYDLGVCTNDEQPITNYYFCILQSDDQTLDY